MTTLYTLCSMLYYLYINRGRYVHAILCPRLCVAALKQPRVAACDRAAHGEAAYPRIAAKPPCDRPAGGPPQGRAGTASAFYKF